MFQPYSNILVLLYFGPFCAWEVFSLFKIFFRSSFPPCRRITGHWGGSGSFFIEAGEGGWRLLPKEIYNSKNVKRSLIHALPLKTGRAESASSTGPPCAMQGHTEGMKITCHQVAIHRNFCPIRCWHVLGVPSQVHDYLRSKLCSLYENDCIFDKFECVWNGSDR